MKSQIKRARMFFDEAEKGVLELNKASRWPVIFPFPFFFSFFLSNTFVFFFFFLFNTFVFFFIPYMKK